MPRKYYVRQFNCSAGGKHNLGLSKEKGEHITAICGKCEETVYLRESFFSGRRKPRWAYEEVPSGKALQMQLQAART